MKLLESIIWKVSSRYRCIGCASIIALSMGTANVMANVTAGGSGTEFPEVKEVQQNITRVTGTVTDIQGAPLIGVGVAVTGTKNNVITDVDGKFSVAVPSRGAEMVFTYIGFKTIKKTATDATMDIVMEENSAVLKEIVVVGYGSMKKENLTGAVASVDVGKALGSRPIADVGRGLQGIAAGLNVVLPSAEIGSDPLMKIRGNIGSINGKSDPLILLDNVEIPSIQLVNPEDIESISVLKDAASASIYGAKAAFGVILITTKKGAKDRKIDIQYSNNFAWMATSKDIEMATIDGLEYAMQAAERVQATFTGAFFKIDRNSLERTKEWQKMYGGKLDLNDPMVYGRDWYKQGLYNYGVRLYNPADYMINDWTTGQNHSLTIGGTSVGTTYNIGLGYMEQNSLLKPAKKDDFKRHNASFRISSDLNKYITARGSFIYSNRDKRSPYSSTYSFDPWYYMYRWSAVMPWGADEYGDPMRTPAFDMNTANTASREHSYTSASMGVTINLASNWDVVADYTYARNESTTTLPGTRYTARNLYVAPSERIDGFGNKVYMNQHGAVVPQDLTNPLVSQAYDFPWQTYQITDADIYKRAAGANRQGVLNIFSTYNLKLGEKGIHDFKFMVGSNRVTNDYDSNWTQINNVFDPKNPQLAQALGVQTGGGSSTWEAQVGFFGRINYIYNNKYLLEANLRYDGSSKFPSDLQWQWFPSFSGGWIASEESFMKPLNPVLSFLKVRGSWGSIGDQTVAAGLYLPMMAKRELNWIDGSGAKAITFDSPKITQPDISWQRIETLDIGLDARFFNDKFGVTADWYQRKTKNMITTGATIAQVIGTSSPQGNYAELTTEGWELSLDFNHRFANGIGINATASLYDSKSKFTDFYDESEKSIWGYYKGKTYGEIWGYTTDRLYQKGDFVWADEAQTIPVKHTITAAESQKEQGKIVNKLAGDNPVYQSYLQGSSFVFGPGDVKYKDMNGDGFIDAGTATTDDHGDLSVIGNNTPRYEYSFRLGADYKGVDLSVYVQGIGKRDVWGAGPLAIPGNGIGDGAMPQAIAGDFWTESNTDAFYPRAWNMYTSNTGYNMQTQSRYLLDMSYLRIKNITVGYSFDSKLLKNIYMSKARVYMSLENMFTFDNLRGLPIDPETIAGNSMFMDTDNYNSGRIGTGAPSFKIVSFGMQVTF